MIDFSLSEEERAVRDTIRQFIQQEVMPLEPQVLRNERQGLPPLEPGQLTELQLKAKAGGWWGINTPEEYGGIALGPVMSAIVAMETGRTFVPFRFGGSADNILYAGTDEQKQQYLIPTINGERRSCFAITEPGAGSDARSIRTRAVKVKVAAPVQPVVPTGPPGSPFVPVEFTGMTVTPYVNQAGRLAYSLKATGIRAPGRGRPGPETREVAA